MAVNITPKFITSAQYRDTMRKRNPNIVVSGASKGIGRSIVKHFFDRGFDVAFCARNNKDLIQFKNELEALDRDQKVLAISCDVSLKDDVIDFAQQVAFEFEVIDVLVNNAGVFKPGDISTEEDGVFETVMNTNVASAYHLTRHILPSMTESEHAHVFNICSTASIMAYPNGGTYCISKFALLGMSKVLREQLKPQGIAVSALLPGPTHTASWSGVDLPPERFIHPDQVAQTLWDCYQLSPQTVIEELIIRPMGGDLL